MSAPRPIAILIAALGGEGGGVLCGWLIRAAEDSGLLVQSTSIPGVAQRTGATTYYLEIFPTPLAELGTKRPVLSLYPTVGDVDLMVASEIVEAGRAMHAGYVTPDRTTLIASTHRVFAIAERAAQADGRFDLERLAEAAGKRAKNSMLGDLAAVARRHRSVLNAVLLGLMAGTGILPIKPETFRDAIRADGRAVESNISGFNAGLALAKEGALPVYTGPAPEPKWRRRAAVAEIEDRVSRAVPENIRDVVREGARRLVVYQGSRYAGRYLDRVAALTDTGAGTALLRETARLLALWMSYEDIIRVAQIKIDPARYRKALEEARAPSDEPVRMTEFFKPGIEEACAILPGFIGRPLARLAARRGWKFQVGLHIRTTSLTGFLAVWMLARLRFLRPRTWRFREEQLRIDDWLARITRGRDLDETLALEIAATAELLKGYGDTYRRGATAYDRIQREIVDPALDGAMPVSRAADALANARAAALSDPTGTRLGAFLDSVAKSAAAAPSPVGITRAAE